MVLVYTRLADLNIIENSYGGGRSMKYDRCVQPRVLRSKPKPEPESHISFSIGCVHTSTISFVHVARRKSKSLLRVHERK